MKLIVSFTLCLFILSGCQNTSPKQSAEASKNTEKVPDDRVIFTLHHEDRYSSNLRYPKFCEAPYKTCGEAVDYTTLAGRSGYFATDPAVLFADKEDYKPVTLPLVMDNGERYNYKTIFGIFSNDSPFASLSYSHSNGYQPDGKDLYVFNVKSKGEDIYGRPQEGLEHIEGICFYTILCNTIDGEILNGLEGYFTGNQRKGIGGKQDEMKLENGLTIWVKEGPRPENFLSPLSEINAASEFTPIPLLNSNLLIVKKEYVESDSYSYDTEVLLDRLAGQSLFEKGTNEYTVEGFPPFNETKLEIMKGVVEKLKVQGEALDLLLTIMLQGGVKYDDYDDFYTIHDGRYIDNVTLYFELTDSLSRLKGAFRTNSFYPEYALQCGKELEKQAFESTGEFYVQIFIVEGRNRRNVERIISDNCGIRLKEHASVELVPNTKKEMFKLMLEFDDLYFK